MPTREEIVKALRCDCDLDKDCAMCPYRNNFCILNCARDAADLIEQQAKEIERLKTDVAKEFICFVGNPHRVKECPYGDRLEELEELESSYQQVKKVLDDAGFESLDELLEATIDEIEQLGAERDAAIADLYKAKSCNTCAKQYKDDCLLEECMEPCSAFAEGDVPYEWRGVGDKPNAD